MSVPSHEIVTPPQQKILQDIKECVTQLTEEFTQHRVPVNDDSQTLQRFCAKLEYLLQTHMKDKYSMLGRKKDYWDYIVESLSSTKGLTDGIKYVKSMSEHKTSLGRGRAFLRFSLVHHRLPDSIQQCATNPRLSEWYQPQSVWFQADKITDLIGCLYDLNDINFDLSPKGYDLDNSWPSFAKKQSGNFNWNPPSRWSSVSSLASLQTMDSSSVVNLSTTPDKFFTQNLESVESAHLDLQVKVDSLEQQNMEVTQHVWTAQGELNAVTEQLKEQQTRHDDLLVTHQELNKRHDKLMMEKDIMEKEWKQREQSLSEQQETAAQKLKHLEISLADVKTELEVTKRKMADIVNKNQTEKNDLELKLKGTRQELQLMQESERKEKQQRETVEERMEEVERKNKELLVKLEASLDTKGREASTQMESAIKLQQLVDTLKEKQCEISKLSASASDLEQMLNLCKSELSQVQCHNAQLEEMLKTERENNLKNLNSLTEKMKMESEVEIEKIKSEIILMEKSCQKMLNENEADHSREITLLKEMLEEKSKVVLDIFTSLSVLCSNDACDVSKTNILNLNENDLVEKLKSVVMMLKEERDCLQNKMRKEEEAKSKLQGDFETLEKENLEMNENLKTLKTENEKLKKEKEKIENELITSQVSKQEEITLTEQSLEAVRSELSSKTELVESRDVCLAEMRLELETQKEEVKKLNSVIETTQLTLCHLLSSFSKNKTEYKTENFKMEDALSAIKLHFETMATRLSDVSSERDLLSEQLCHLQSGDSDRSRELCSFQERVRHMEDKLRQSRETETELRQELSQRDSELKEASQVVTQLKSTLEKLSSDFQALKEEKIKVEEENISLRSEIKSLQQNISHLKVAMTTAEEKYQEKGESFEEKNKDLEKKLKERDSEFEKKIQMLSEDTENIKSQKSNLETKLKEISEILTREKAEKEKTESELKELCEEKVDLRESLEKLRQDFQSKEKQLSELTHRLDAEREELTNQLEEALTDTGVIKTQLTEKLQELEDVCSTKSQLMKENENLTSSLDELDKRCQALAQKLSFFEKSKSDEVSLSETWEKEKNNMEEMIDRLKQEVDERNKMEDGLKTEIEEVREENVLLKSDVQTLEEQNEDLKESLTQLEAEKSDMEEKVSSIVSELPQLKAELRQKDKMLKNKVTENEEFVSLVDNLKQCVSALQSALDDKTKKLGELKSFNSQKQTSLQIQVESLTQEISALQFQLSAEQLQHQEALKSSTGEIISMSDMQARLAEQEGLIAQLEQEVTSQSMRRNEEMNVQSKELSELQSLLSVKDEECQTLIQHIHNIETDLNQEKLAHQDLKVRFAVLSDEQEQRLSEKDQEISELKSDRKQLARKVVKLVREKDALWQRTDQLTFEQKVQASDKWMDAGTVTHCLSCKAEFSLWLRKHHCRLCGRIFCYSCSDYWVETAHSSKKERACHSCHSRLQTLGSDSNVSLLSQDSDDDEFTASITAVVPSSSREQSVSSYSDNGVNMTEAEIKRLCREGTPVCDETFESSEPSAESGKESFEPAEESFKPAEESFEPAEVSYQSADQSCQSPDQSYQPANDSYNSADLSGEAKTENINNDVDVDVDAAAKDVISSNDKAADVCHDDGEGEKTEQELRENAAGKIESEDPFHVITDEEVTRSLTEYDTNLLQTAVTPNMQSSMVLSAEELAKGEINSQNEMWLKPGVSFAVPVSIETENTVLYWTFSSHPKDIVFSVNYRTTTTTPLDAAEEVVSPCKCDSHKQAVHGEITAKQTGIYTLLFDNTYSKLTSKKVHYHLKLKFS